MTVVRVAIQLRSECSPGWQHARVPRSVAIAAVIVAAVVPAAHRAFGQPLIADMRLGAVGLSRTWQADLPLTPRDRVAEARLVDDTLYIKSRQSVLFAVDVRTGLIRWADKIADAEFPLLGPTHLLHADGAGPAVLMAAGEIILFDRYSGDRLATFVPKFTFTTTPVGYDNFLFAGTFDGQMHSMLLASSSQLLYRWQVQVEDTITATPLLYGNKKLLFADHAGMVYACGAFDKSLQWQFQTNDKVVGDPTVDDTGVYIASADRSLYKLDGPTGRLLWQERFPCELLAGPVIAGDSVYQFCTSDGLTALDSASGIRRWNLPTGTQYCTTVDDRDIVLTNRRRVLFVDHQSGELRDELDAGPITATVSSGHNQTLFLIAGDGRVLCARPKGAPPLPVSEVQRAKERLHLPPAKPKSDESAPATGGGNNANRNANTSDDPFRSRRDRP